MIITVTGDHKQLLQDSYMGIYTKFCYHDGMIWLPSELTYYCNCIHNYEYQYLYRDYDIHNYECYYYYSGLI